MAKVKKRTWNNKNGTIGQCWQIDYTDSSGKRVMKGGFKTKASAQKALAKVITDIESGINLKLDKKIVFEDAAKEFIELHAEIHCKPSTLKGYKSYLKNHIIPFFGRKKLNSITPKTINEFISKKVAEGLSNKSINQFLILIGSILEKQIDEGRLNINPARKIRKLKLPYKEMNFLKREEIFLLLNAAKDHYPDFYPLLLTAITTGMRRGELLGLTWDCINWDSRKIKVNKSLYRGKLIEPKTSYSIRLIDMPEKLFIELQEWKKCCPKGEVQFVFPDSMGGFTDADNMIKRRFNRCFELAGINRIRFHDLRHTYASILIAENVPIKYIQQMLGHSSIQVTMDRYGHLLPEVYQQGLDAFDRMLEN